MRRVGFAGLGITGGAMAANLLRAGFELAVWNRTRAKCAALEAEGVIHGARPGLVVIDHSTIRPDATQRFATLLAERGVALLDAPVSGGDVGARNATLTMMVGGPAEAFERVLPLLRAVGKSVTHLGPSGMAQVCKAANQICVAVNLLGACEALAFARRAGLDLGRAIEVLSGGAAASYLREVADAGGAALGTQAMGRALEARGGFRYAERE